MPENGAAELVLTGEFMGSDVVRWTNQNTKEKGQTTVLVFRGESVSYPEKVRVGKDSVQRALAGAPEAGEVGSAVVFASKFGELWFKEWKQS